MNSVFNGRRARTKYEKKEGELSVSPGKTERKLGPHYFNMETVFFLCKSQHQCETQNSRTVAFYLQREKKKKRLEGNTTKC